MITLFKKYNRQRLYFTHLQTFECFFLKVITSIKTCMIRVAVVFPFFNF